MSTGTPQRGRAVQECVGAHHNTAHASQIPMRGPRWVRVTCPPAAVLFPVLRGQGVNFPSDAFTTLSPGVKAGGDCIDHKDLRLDRA